MRSIFTPETPNLQHQKNHSPPQHKALANQKIPYCTQGIGALPRAIPVYTSEMTPPLTAPPPISQRHIQADTLDNKQQPSQTRITLQNDFDKYSTDKSTSLAREFINSGDALYKNKLTDSAIIEFDKAITCLNNYAALQAPKNFSQLSCYYQLKTKAELGKARAMQGQSAIPFYEAAISSANTAIKYRNEYDNAFLGFCYELVATAYSEKARLQPKPQAIDSYEKAILAFNSSIQNRNNGNTIAYAICQQLKAKTQLESAKLLDNKTAILACSDAIKSLKIATSWLQSKQFTTSCNLLIQRAENLIISLCEKIKLNNHNHENVLKKKNKIKSNAVNQQVTIKKIAEKDNCFQQLHQKKLPRANTSPATFGITHYLQTEEDFLSQRVHSESDLYNTSSIWKKQR